MENREKVAKIIYEETSSYFIREKTQWENIAEFVKKDFFITADKIMNALVSKEVIENG